MRLLMCCVLSVVTISPVCADIMLTTTSGLSFAQNSGIHSFQLFGKSAPTDPAITSLISTITIDSGTSGLGIFTSPISFTSNFNPSNLNAASTGSIDSLDARIANLSLDFNAPQLIPSVSPGVLGTFNFNVNGLGPGFYSILLTENNSDGVGVTGVNGQFEIVSIPEPSVLGATVIGIGIIFFRWRRDRSSI